MSRHFFITGGARGLGRSLTEEALQRGHRVTATSRSGQADFSHPNLEIVALDVNDDREVRRVVHSLKELDVVVNNAGFGLLGAVEEATSDDIEAVFSTNFLGPLRVIQAVLPRLRARRGGHIVNITSIAGLAPMAGSGLYAAAKFAVEGMSQALAQEVRPLGIRVTLVEPGAFRTDFLSQESIRYSGQRIDDYAATSGQMVAALNAMDGKQLGDPRQAARAILDALDTPEPPLQLVLGSDALRRTRARLEELSRELDLWKDLTLSTDFSVVEA